MKNLTITESSRPLLLQARVEAAGRKSAVPRRDTTPVAGSAPPASSAPPAAPEVDLEAVATITAELQAALDQLSGPRREVQLRFEDDGQYVVEVRSIHDGEVIQRFPPENLLNLRGSVADLLGTVVDRLS